MASSCIKYFILLQNAYAAQHSELTLVQLRAAEVPKSGNIRACASDLPRRDDLHWMHSPKTGTTFKFTVQQVNPNYKLGHYHEPLPKDAGDRLLSGFTAMLRDPAQRLASALAYIGENSPQGGWMFTEGHGCGAADVFELVKNGKTPRDDECLGSLVGCQTNMLVGKGCMSAASHNKSDIDIAKDRLDKFFFVGLLEEWELSMCLFNFKLTGKRYVEECQTMVYRATDRSAPSSFHAYDVAGYPRDKADEEIYRHGKERFQREIAKHGINKESCAPKLVDAVPE